jgi:hypothetical protein
LACWPYAQGVGRTGEPVNSSDRLKEQRLLRQGTPSGAAILLHQRDSISDDRQPPACTTEAISTWEGF